MGGDGLFLKTELNKMPTPVPFILMSGKLDKDAILGFINLKVDHVFEKPFSFEDLEYQIDTNVKKYQETKEKDKLSFIGKNTGKIIHDINNHLGVIMMSSDVGISLASNEKVLKLLEKSKAACSRIVEVVSRYKKLANQSNDIILKTYNVEDFSKEIEEVASAFAEVNGISFKTSFNLDKTKNFDLDIVLIREAILNILANARDALSPQKYKLINLNIQTTEKILIIEISDNGPGIPENIQKKMFEEKVSTKGNFGTGMGMMYCKFVVDIHLGDIKIDSNNQGTTFKIYLPLGEQNV
jgi:signal transduction histidine kinase